MSNIICSEKHQFVGHQVYVMLINVNRKKLSYYAHSILHIIVKRNNEKFLSSFYRNP